jgi:transcriptional regulator with XRE-family HTH domain
LKLDEIGAEIKSLRKTKRLTQEQLADIAGISRVTLGKLERGQVGAISLKTMDIILATLGYEIAIKPKNSFGLPSLDELL